MAKNFKRAEMLILPTTNEKIEKFINHIMLDWKKSVARKIFKDTLDEIKTNWHANPISVWEGAIENSSPQIMVKSKRLWWAIYQVPVEVPVKKRYFFACKWILEAVKAKKWKPFHKRLSDELLACYSWQWVAVKKKDNVHKMADANKAFAYLAKYIK
jgi:small subunit ribosomal protein S7